MVDLGFIAFQSSQVGFPSVGATGDFYRDAMILATDLDRLALSIRSFREPLRQSVREVVIPSIRKNFDVEGRPQWAALRQETVRKRGATGPILNEKGRLKRVAQQINIWEIGSHQATITGLDGRVKYAKYHQGGTTKMVSRPFLMFQEEDQDNIEDVFYRWLYERSVRQGRFPP